MVFSLFDNPHDEDLGINLKIDLEEIGNDGILFLRGKHDRASPIFLSGKLRLSNCKKIHCRKIYIRLMGKIRLNVPIPAKKIYKTHEVEFIKLESYFYQHCWDEIENFGLLKCSNPVSSNEMAKEVFNKTPNFFKSLFSDINNRYKHPRRNIIMFNPGEHILSFSAVLPGDLPESVHNHPNVFVAYQLCATIQQCKGLPDLTATRQLMFIRTISVDMLDFQNSEFAEIKSKNKMSIHVELPWKIAAIGSKLDISCTVKSKNNDIKITNVIIKLIEYSKYQHKNKVVNKRRKINEIKVSDPHFFSKFTTGSTKQRINHFKCFSFPIPNNLSQLTQDCSIMEKLTILHELEMNVKVLLPNHKICQFELHLPVYLYISSFIPVNMVQRNYFKEPSLHFSKPYLESDGPLPCDSSTLTNYYSKNNNNTDISNFHILMKDLFPSSYENHVYDAKVEIYDHINTSRVNYVNNSSIIMCDSSNITKLNSLYDVKYPPPHYEVSDSQARNGRESRTEDYSVDLIDMKIDYLKTSRENIMLESIL